MRFLAVSIAAMTAVYLVAVLGWGAWAVTWEGICLDPGEDPACEEGAGDDLSVVRASSWALAAGAGAAVVLAFILALRVRRAAQLAPVVLLCVLVGAVGVFLWSRLL